MKQRKGLESLGDRLVHNCHEPSQSGTLIRLFLASFRSKTEMQLISNDAEMLRAPPPPPTLGVLPYKGLLGACASQDMFFRIVALNRVSILSFCFFDLIFSWTTARAYAKIFVYGQWIK